MKDGEVILDEEARKKEGVHFKAFGEAEGLAHEPCGLLASREKEALEGVSLTLAKLLWAGAGRGKSAAVQEGSLSVWTGAFRAHIRAARSLSNVRESASSFSLLGAVPEGPAAHHLAGAAAERHPKPAI